VAAGALALAGTTLAFAGAASAAQAAPAANQRAYNFVTLDNAHDHQRQGRHGRVLVVNEQRQHG
jgi:Spy/CpxP family protein refolding chaperone